MKKTISFSAVVKKLVKPCFVKIPKLLFQSYNYDQWCHAVRVKPKFSKEDKQNVDLCIHLLDTLGQGYGEYVEEDYPFDAIKSEENAPEGIKIEAVEQQEEWKCRIKIEAVEQQEEWQWRIKIEAVEHQEEWKPNLNESLADIKIKLEKEEGIGYGEYVEEYYDEIKIEENAIGYGEYVEEYYDEM